MTKYYTKSMTVTMYDGTVKRVKFRGKTPQEAEEKLREAQIKQSLGKFTIGGEMPFADWAKQWEEFYAAPIKTPRSCYQSVRALNKYFVSRIGKMKMGDIRPIHIQGCANQLQGSSKSLIMQARAAIKDVMKKAVANNLIYVDPTESVQWPIGTYKGHRALTPAEREIFMEVVKTRSEWLIFAIMYGLGLRDNEARALRWSDIDFKENIVHITAAVKQETGELGEPKSKSGIRDLHLPKWLAEMLTGTPKTALFVCPTRWGTPLSTNVFAERWGALRNAMLTEAGIPTAKGKPDKVMAAGCSISDLTPYCLRHNYCTMMAENEVPLKTAQYFMGHSSIEMTAQIYTHVTKKMFDTAKEKIDAMWSPVLDTTGQISENAGHLAI